MSPASISQSSSPTPINCDTFETVLAKHPNPQLVRDVCQGLRYGVDIGFQGPRKSSRTPNMKSALDNPEVIKATIAKKLASGWSLGPFSSPPFPNFVINSIGVVPKKTGGFGMITDLSRPDESANSGISKDLFTLEYSSIYDAVAILSKAGPDIFMCKLDVKDAFRLIPARPEDWPLLFNSI